MYRKASKQGQKEIESVMQISKTGPMLGRAVERQIYVYRSGEEKH